ncbi:MAG: DUF58 domain-containing protein [Planctomycetes bacterium]|nr:DUF58 domain-containing protein [Planctomycetota bacterium]
MIDPEILKQVRRIQVHTSRLVTDVMAGGYSSVFRGSGIEFDEVREYSDGDDPRSVDWNVTARTGRPYIKKFVEERELTVVFLLDLSLSMRAGFLRRSAREAAAEFCACLALSAIRNNDKVGFVAFTDRVEHYTPPKKGIGHVLRIVRDCLALEAKGRATDVVPALEFIGHVLRRRAIVFLVSDFMGGGFVQNAEFDHALALVRRRHDLIAARFLTSELDLANRPRARGLLRVRDYESGREILCDFSSAAVRESYQKSVAAWNRALDERMRRARVDSIRVPVAQPVVEPILQFFRGRELKSVLHS